MGYIRNRSSTGQPGIKANISSTSSWGKKKKGRYPMIHFLFHQFSYTTPISNSLGEGTWNNCVTNSQSSSRKTCDFPRDGPRQKLACGVDRSGSMALILCRYTGSTHRRTLHLVECSAVAALKFLIIFEQGASHFNFALGPRNNVADCNWGWQYWSMGRKTSQRNCKKVYCNL